MIKWFSCALIPWHNDRLKHKLLSIFQIFSVHHDGSNNLEQCNDRLGHKLWSIFKISSVHHDASNLEQHSDRLGHKLWFIFQISNVHHDASNLEQHNDIFGHEIYIYDLFSTYLMSTMMHQTWTSLENYQTMIILCLHYNQIKI
jgi:hypothetical protein